MTYLFITCVNNYVPDYAYQLNNALLSTELSKCFDKGMDLFFYLGTIQKTLLCECGVRGEGLKAFRFSPAKSGPLP